MAEPTQSKPRIVVDLTLLMRLVRRFAREPDPRAAAWAAYVGELERRKSTPPRVSPGDFICLEGKYFRIGSVDARSGTVHTEQLDEDGRVVSGCPSDAWYLDGSPLLPVAPPEKLPPIFIPPQIRDGIGRARYLSRQHELLLIRAGLLEDEDDD